MKALDRIRPTQGIAAMQSINAAAPSSLFGMTLLGTAAACALLAIFSLFRWHKPGAGYLVAGSLLYLAGAILVTMIFNVPKNKVLAAVDMASGEGARLWIDYVSSWTAWNHVRTAAYIAAAASFTYGVRA
ncbi:MAG TPA: anthrone oxygenase family protein [Pyrinomonadaceae bacterium]|nr:anthrone oxygenase family protein [Pyrinomonadaceae bacterium]